MFWKKREFMEWKDYKAKIEILDEVLFRQEVRQHNLKQ